MNGSIIKEMGESTCFIVDARAVNIVSILKRGAFFHIKANQLKRRNKMNNKKHCWCGKCANTVVYTWLLGAERLTEVKGEKGEGSEGTGSEKS
jgi:hypothetical protein